MERAMKRDQVCNMKTIFKNTFNIVYFFFFVITNK